MNIEQIREYCLNIKGAEEDFPFNDTVIAFKIVGKMFAYMDLSPRPEGFFINLKCDPEQAIELREKYECVVPGYHANKKYWNSIYIERELKTKELKYWIDHSVEEVLKKLSKKQRLEYEASKN